jgi:hypothetical protein
VASRSVVGLLRSKAGDDRLRQPIKEFTERVTDYLGLTAVFFGHGEILLEKKQNAPHGKPSGA